MPQACRPMWNVNFMTICSAASWPMASSAGLAVTRATKSCCALQLQTAGVCPSCAGRRMAQTAAHFVERVTPLGADAPMGHVGARTLAVLDGLFTGPHRAGPYDHPYHDWAVLCAPGGHTVSHETRSNRGR